MAIRRGGVDGVSLALIVGEAAWQLSWRVPSLGVLPVPGEEEDGGHHCLEQRLWISELCFSNRHVKEHNMGAEADKRRVAGELATEDPGRKDSLLSTQPLTRMTTGHHL